MNLVLLSGDLVAASRIQGAASRIAAQLRTTTTPDQAVASCGDGSVRVVLVDLTMTDLEIGPLVKSLKRCAAPPAVVAFGPHVHEDRLAAARDAGCDEVLSRGQFFAQIDPILSRHAK